MSVRVYNNLNDSDLRFNYFQTIDQTLSKPLELANRNRKLNKEREKLLSNKNIRYMEDHFVTISDLILFFFICLILNKDNEIKNELNKYKNINEWFRNMSNDSRILKSFINLNKFTINFYFGPDTNKEDIVDYKYKSIELNLDNLNLNDNQQE
jgi:hypothetical protein